MKVPNESETTPTTVSASNADKVSEVTAVEVIAGQGLVLSRRPLDPLSERDVEIAPLYSFISAGTELSTVQSLSNAPEGSHEPARMGYSQCGIVKRVGAKVKGISVGDRVVAIGAGAFHATRTIVGQNLVVPLPEGVCTQEASLAAMFCFALESVYKSAAKIGDNVVVFGAGMMGQMASRLYSLSGARVCVMDSNDFRLGLLPEGMTTFPLNDEGWQGLAKWAKPYGVEHANICFGGDATEAIEKLKSSMSIAPDGVPHGRIVFPGGAKISLLMASNMGNIELISSAKAGPGYRDPVYESGMDYPLVYVHHTVRRNIATMLQLMADGLLDFSNLITQRYAFNDAQKAYEWLQQPNVPALAVLLEYEQAASAK